MSDDKENEGIWLLIIVAAIAFYFYNKNPEDTENYKKGYEAGHGDGYEQGLEDGYAKAKSDFR